jgi:hypothetical protein
MKAWVTEITMPTSAIHRSEDLEVHALYQGTQQMKHPQSQMHSNLLDLDSKKRFLSLFACFLSIT